MTGGVMSQKFVVGAGLLVCSVCSLSAMAGSKPVDLILRVLVDAPPPCSIKGSQVEFGNMIADNVDGTNLSARCEIHVELHKQSC